jgi:hypothetical protein
LKAGRDEFPDDSHEVEAGLLPVAAGADEVELDSMEHGLFLLVTSLQTQSVGTSSKIAGIS